MSFSIFILESKVDLVKLFIESNLNKAGFEVAVRRKESFCECFSKTWEESCGYVSEALRSKHLHGGLFA